MCIIFLFFCRVFFIDEASLVGAATRTYIMGLSKLYTQDKKMKFKAPLHLFPPPSPKRSKGGVVILSTTAVNDGDLMVEYSISFFNFTPLLPVSEDVTAG